MLRTPAMVAMLTRQTTTLIVMDVQEKLVAAMAPEVRGAAIDNVIRLVQGARILGVPIIVTEQYPHGLGPTIETVRQALQELEGPPTPIEKVEFDACRDGNFTRSVEMAAGNRSAPGNDGPSIVLCGMETHVCVYQTARTLVTRGMQVHVPMDATCCRSAHNHVVAQGLLRDMGATVTSTETALFDLLGRAGHDEFRSISNLVR